MELMHPVVFKDMVYIILSKYPITSIADKKFLEATFDLADTEGE